MECGGIWCSNEDATIDIDEDDIVINTSEEDFDLSPSSVEEVDGTEYQLMQVSSQVQRMLDLVNRERRSRGRPQLCLNSKLNAAAQAHSNDMASKNYFSHTGADGSEFWMRIQRKGYSNAATAENIAINSSIDRAHTSLMNSQGHRTNILNSRYKHVGIGVSKYTSGRWRGSYVITQVFGDSNTEGCTGGGGGGRCSNSPRGWYDSDGPSYDCAWYAQGNNCQRYGSGYRNFGRTANEACCACGGSA